MCREVKKHVSNHEHEISMVIKGENKKNTNAKVDIILSFKKNGVN